MRALSRGLRAAIAQAERIPLMGRMQSGTREGMFLGAAWGALVLLVLGGALGGLNRGVGGILVGATSGAVAGLFCGAVLGALLGTRHLPQRGRASLAIELDERGRSATVGAPGSYAPGEAIDGAVVVHSDSTLRINGIKVYFVCRGFYVHDQPGSDNSSDLRFERDAREYLLLQTDVASPGILRRGSSESYPFRFTIPLGALPTHRGHICAIRWSLHAMLEAPDLEPLEARREVLVQAPAPKLAQTAGDYQSVVTTQGCQLILTLPRAAYGEGEAVAGRVHITPQQPLYVDTLRVVLLRVESTPLGDDHTVYVTAIDRTTGSVHGERWAAGMGTTYIWPENEATLGEAVRLEANAVSTWPFALQIPSQWRPTLQSKDGRVVWKVGVIVSRAEHTDLRAFHEVIVYTGGPVTVPDSSGPQSAPEPEAAEVTDEVRVRRV